MTEQFGRRLKALRLQMGLQQSDLSGRGVSVSLVSMLENGNREPTERVIKHLAAALGVEPRVLSVLSKWDDRALALARTVADWSSCTRDHVGAVVMSPEHDVISTGFNDTPAGGPNCDEGGCVRVGRSSGAPYADDELCLHAEDNALQRAGLRARGATLYVTREPCGFCARRAMTAGIVRTVVATARPCPRCGEPLRMTQPGDYVHVCGATVTVD